MFTRYLYSDGKFVHSYTAKTISDIIKKVKKDYKGYSADLIKWQDGTQVIKFEHKDQKDVVGTFEMSVDSVELYHMEEENEIRN